MTDTEQVKIDTTGTEISTGTDGKMIIKLDKRVTSRAFQQVLEYLYTDRVSWDKDTDKTLIQETKEVRYLNLMMFLLHLVFSIGCCLPWFEEIGNHLRNLLGQ